MRVRLKHSTSQLSGQTMKVDVDSARRVVRVEAKVLDAKLLGRLVVDRLPRLAPGVVAHEEARQASDAQPAASERYRVVVAFAGAEFDAQVVRLPGGELDVVLHAPAAANATAKPATRRDDLVDAQEASRLSGIAASRLVAWARAKYPRVIAVEDTTEEFLFPYWQFDPVVWAVVPDLAKELGAGGWTTMLWLQTPLGAFSGRSPRQALEQGEPAARVLAVAGASG